MNFSDIIRTQRLSRAKVTFYVAALGIAALLGVAVTLTFNVLLSREQSATIPVIPENSTDADHVFQGIDYTATNKEGMTEWRLTAATARYFEENKRAELKTVGITFYSKEGAVYRVRGDNGVFNTESKDVQLSGNIIGTSNDGYQFRTTSILYKADTKKAQTDDRVFLEGPQVNLEGQGMVVDVEKKRILLLHNVKAHVKR
ncbi:MAG: LPS export ABC transporter periplasmic protein LptC [Deltaproteobacteria bacterium]|nr:LPS export ABC transporter periplasmic protein LptC [Deltaproteobacteria bacterium]